MLPQPKEINEVKSIDDIKTAINLREHWNDIFEQALQRKKIHDEGYDNIYKSISEYKTEIIELQSMLDLKLRNSKRKTSEFPIIDVPASGKPNWYEGARTMCFVYSRNHGNFILRGYLREVVEYLQKNYTHYFYYLSMWSKGMSRGYWKFWKDGVGINEPSKYRKKWKYTVFKYGEGDFFDRKVQHSFEFKRMPRQWIKAFNKL